MGQAAIRAQRLCQFRDATPIIYRPMAPDGDKRHTTSDFTYKRTRLTMAGRGIKVRGSPTP
jgi:hypothetical protein